MWCMHLHSNIIMRNERKKCELQLRRNLQLRGHLHVLILKAAPQGAAFSPKQHHTTHYYYFKELTT